ncbi:MAG: hypothetical protein LDL31_10530, partial [Prosthecobacter sp.]|nr:hypothetical protein [Prosthecobacter sp.]
MKNRAQTHFIRPVGASWRKLLTMRPRLPLFPYLTLALYAALWAYLDFRPELERNLKGWLLMLSTLLTALLLLAWFFCSRRFSGRTRLAGLGIT